MKVDLNGADASSLSSVTSTQHCQTVATSVSNAQNEAGIGEDTANLCSGSANIDALTAKALETSEVRQDKIEALRQAVQSGQYKIEPDKIAQAMILQSE
jgi:negative regulator of flagellin synthesis FlgM